MPDEVIDVHIHFGAPPDEASGCHWSKEFENGIAFFAFRIVTGFLLRKITLKRVKRHLLGVINGSEFVHRSVLLALDWVYDLDGVKMDKDMVHLYVPNGYLAGLAKAEEQNGGRVFFGSSIHPYRNDWEAEMDKCLADKAVLCKWIPSSQRIDPSHSKCLPFYKKLEAVKLPLLCHVGPEGAIPPFDKETQKLNSPLLLRNALEAGVTVIVAHAALPFFPPPLEDDWAFREMVSLFREGGARGWKLYTDLSAINLGPRHGYIDRIKEEIPPDRLIFGSDYPIPILDISQKPKIPLWHWLKHFFQTIRIKNPLDKNYRLIKNMDFDERLFTNASRILRPV